MPDLRLNSLEQSATAVANKPSQYAQRRIARDWHSITKSFGCTPLPLAKLCLSALA
jgi:hypothetical protein